MRLLMSKDKEFTRRRGRRTLEKRKGGLNETIRVSSGLRMEDVQVVPGLCDGCDFNMGCLQNGGVNCKALVIVKAGTRQRPRPCQ